MKTAAMIQKAWREDSSAMPINEILDMVSVNAAKALGLDTGRLEVGALADVIIVDMDNYHFLSPAPFEANLIYSAHSDCIESVICNGKFVMRNRAVEGEKEILSQASKVLMNLF
jgi:5-methylthioadenosine/S-adenosylhomocysteine deaminase